MLDADEAAAFDETAACDPGLAHACQEMDRLAAAIAVTHSQPVAPRAGQLDRLHRRLGLATVKRTNWPAISGWAAAAALAGFAILRPTPALPTTTLAKVSPASELAMPKTVVVTEIQEDADALEPSPFPILHDQPVEETELAQAQLVKGQTKQLIQEIEVLRGQLESFQIRDRERFEPTPGMAWPIVMRMVPPDPPVNAPPVFNAAALAAADTQVATASDDPPMAAMLGDALAYARESAGVPKASPVPAPPTASAIPIYDAARDKGTLVVNNLPVKGADESYNLWVTTDNAKQPIYVGRLPESSKPGADSIDFSLGATAVVPSGFLLTRDPLGNPPPPSQHSTILLGPR